METTFFLIRTPFGGEDTTCPYCAKCILINAPIGAFTTDNLDIEDDYLNSKNNIEYCNSCNNIFRKGCTYAENGCTDSEYNAVICTKYKLYNDIYDGTPKFLNFKEFYDLIKRNKFSVLEWKCTHSNKDDDNGFYPKSKYPQYYKVCKY